MQTLSLKSMTNIQKVAAFLIAMGPEAAADMLRELSEEAEVEKIAMEIASMQRISQELMTDVLEEFYTLFQARGYLASGGVGYARQLLDSAFGNERASKILEKLVASLQTSPFEFFNNADPTQLATSFQHENPQLVALVLSYLKPERSAAIMGGLSPEMQTEVAMRIAEMDRTNPEVLREVERILESKFSSVVSADFTLAGGIDALADIINRSDRTTEKIILEGLELKDPEIAEKVRELMFVFEDIIHLDDRSVQRVLREVETKDLAMALKGSNEDVKEKIFKNMSERAAAMLADDMEFMGPVRAKDVQERQTIIVGIVRALEETGELVINRGGTDSDDFIS
ncbi:MAG: flagellar motor switch protein FliG [Vampirovibrionales bacterium]|nr:flagellar motor switch protein FliG [Vampirovibrionales bacterium]